MSDLRFALALTLTLAACGQAKDEANLVEATNLAVAPPAENADSAVLPANRAPASVFTTLDETKCLLVEENKEEGPYWLRSCPGHAGWKLEWSESDLRQGLSVISPGGRETELRLSDLVAKGAFNSLGKTVEWRGQNAATPDALIVRMSVARGDEPQLPDVSRLAVARLTRTPCLAAIVEPGPRQNEKARAIADAPMAECVSD